MIRFAKLLAQGAPSPAAFAAYAAEVGAAEADAARRLLSGQRPKRLASPATLLDWVAQATQTPEFLVQACLQACPDKAEVAALLLPPAEGTSPTLTEALASLTGPADYMALACRLPPEARLVLTRLACGTFRARLGPDALADPTPGRCLGILTMIDPSGPEGTFALPHGNALVPLAKVRLTLPETPQILTWARAHTTDRFGPQRQVSPTLVFELAFDATTPNPRRKCGLDLVAPRLIAWARETSVDQVPPLASLLASLP